MDRRKNPYNRCPQIIDDKKCDGYLHRDGLLIFCTRCDYSKIWERETDKALPEYPEYRKVVA